MDKRLEFLMMREQVMENIDCIVDGMGLDTDVADELVTKLCDMVCETLDPAGF